MSHEIPRADKPHPLRLPTRKIAIGVLVVYLSVASNYLKLDPEEVSLVVKHPTAQLTLIYLLALLAIKDSSTSWTASLLSAGIVTGAFLLLAYGL